MSKMQLRLEKQEKFVFTKKNSLENMFRFSLWEMK